MSDRACLYGVITINILDADAFVGQSCVNKLDKVGPQRIHTIVLMHVTTSDEVATSSRARARRLRINAIRRPGAS
jgi:hypothetical protein